MVSYALTFAHIVYYCLNEEPQWKREVILVFRQASYAEDADFSLQIIQGII